MGAPRKVNANGVSTTIRIPAELLDRVQAEADTRMVSRNKLLVWVIERGLGQLVPIDDPLTHREADDGSRGR